MSQTLTQKLNTINSIKDDIKTAIENKGVTVDGAFSTFPRCIDSIETGGGDELAIALIERRASDINIPDGTAQIGDSAFYGYGTMQSVTIPDSVTSIGDYAFRDCTRLASLTIPSSVASIGALAFAGCSSLSSVNIPDGVTSIRDYAFGDCSSLTSFTIPSSVTLIASGTFSGCSSLSSVTIPRGVTSIADNVFSACTSLTSLTIPDGVTSIGPSAFNGSSLSSVTIPDSVTSIMEYAFSSCPFTSFTIPRGLTSISQYTFYYCTSLTSVFIPRGVTSISAFAFNHCSSLASVTIENAEAKLNYNQDAFAEIASNAILYVPEGLLSEYQADSSWSGAFAEIRAIGDEPAAYTITDVSADAGDPEYKEISMQYGETGVYTITFYGTGLSSELDWANIVNVEYSTDDFSDFHFDDVANVTDDGTWISLNYQYTTVSAAEGLTSWPAAIRFTCGEFSGTINASIFKVKSYEWDSNNTDTVNKYPSTINATATVNLGSCSLTDTYLNDDAKQWIADNILQIPMAGVTYEVTNIEDGVSMIDEWSGEYHVTINWTITAPNDKAFVANLQWEEMTAVEHTFEVPVHISRFTLNDVIAINGDDWVHLTKNENDAFVLPQVGPTLLLPLTGLNDGVNVWDDTVNSWISYDADGTDIGFDMNLGSLEEYEIDGTQYHCVRIDTNEISREQLSTAKEDNGGTIPPLKINVRINGVSQSLDAVLQQTDMALPTGCTQITDGIANNFNEEDSGNQYYVNTDIMPTANTIVKAELGLRSTHGNYLIGNQGIDDVTDWRLFSTGTIVDQTDPWTIYFDYGNNEDLTVLETGLRITASVPRANIVDENDNPKRLKFTMSNGKLEIFDSNNEQLVNKTGINWTGYHADQMQPICIYQQVADSNYNVDSATMYWVEIYDSDLGVDLNAPLARLIPVTINGETKVFDTVTRKYLDRHTTQQ